jgi:lysozyme family protein
MADLAKALAPVLEHEGGWVNDPSDSGKETYRGIARRYHPGWGGWEIVDAQRKHGGIQDGVLVHLVERFYRLEFWDRFQGDRIADQALADELLDQAVNLGVHRAVQHLQRALNALNNQAKRWPDMDRDGKLGPQTLAAIEGARTYGLGKHLVTAIRSQQGVYYLERMEARGINEKFIGWFLRV